MMNLEKITNFIVALGAALTAVASIYKQYNEDKVKNSTTVRNLTNDTV